MSRLDTMIARLQAQRDCLNDAAQRIAGLPGHILELGLGNGRTYDHLRRLFPEREIYVFERELAPHPDCRPDDKHLFLGTMPDTLVTARKSLPSGAALIHADIGFGDVAATAANVAAVAPHLPPLLVEGGLVLCDQDLSAAMAGLSALPLPAGVAPGRYHYYRYAAG